MQLLHAFRHLIIVELRGEEDQRRMEAELVQFLHFRKGLRAVNHNFHELVRLPVLLVCGQIVVIMVNVFEDQPVGLVMDLIRKSLVYHCILYFVL